MRGDPDIGQELTKPNRRMARQTLQHILEACEWIDVMASAAPHQTVESSRGTAPPITSSEHVALSSNGLSTEASFRDVVIDAQIAVAGVGLHGFRGHHGGRAAG
jgi:hypothetical protein